jgi:hypothetical protein
LFSVAERANASIAASAATRPTRGFFKGNYLPVCDGGHRECTLCLGQLAVSATILAQSIWGWLFERDAIGFVAQLLEIADQRL